LKIIHFQSAPAGDNVSASPETAAASLERCRNENKQRNFKSAVGNRRLPCRLARDNAGVFQRPGGGFELLDIMKSDIEQIRNHFKGTK
jgi:hypothetical protein